MFDKCPLCCGKIISRCQCKKSNSICENDHRFHFNTKLIKINILEIELHDGFGDHFNEYCRSCVIIKTIIHNLN